MERARKNIQVLQKRVAWIIAVLFLLGQMGVMLILWPLPPLAIAFTAVPIATWLSVLWRHYDHEGKNEFALPVAIGTLSGFVGTLLVGFSMSGHVLQVFVLASASSLLMSSLLLAWIKQADKLIVVSLLELRCPDMLILREDELWAQAQKYGHPKNVPRELQQELNRIGKARFWGHY